MRALLALLLLLLPVAAPAVEPDEVLDDPALEARAREISAEIRCLVCQNESIDGSNAGLARDLRLLIRERLVAGDSDAEVEAFLVARYGEFVLLRPRFTLGNAAVWLAGPVLLVLGGLAAWAYIRRRSPEARPAAPAALSEEEEARLARILDQDR